MSKSWVQPSLRRIYETPDSIASRETKSRLSTVLGVLADRLIRDPKTVDQLFQELDEMHENRIIAR